MILVENETTFFFTDLLSIKNLVINIAVNKEVAIPINKVVAKPLIGPVPKINKINAVKPVVIFASRIEERALLNPSETDCFKPLALFNSSLTLSKIKTLASTEIPIVKTIPAIPGRVSTAPRPVRIPKIRRIFKTRAKSAKKPDIP